MEEDHQYEDACSRKCCEVETANEFPEDESAFVGECL